MNNRARMRIMNFIMNFALTRAYPNDLTCKYGPGILGFASHTDDYPAQAGDLVAVTETDAGEWYLGWLRGVEGKGEHAQFAVESLENGEMRVFDRATISYMDRDTVLRNPKWKWSDRQFALNDRWKRVAEDTWKNFGIRSGQLVFGDEYRVTLRGLFGATVLEQEYPDWRAVTIPVMKKLLRKWGKDTGMGFRK